MSVLGCMREMWARDQKARMTARPSPLCVMADLSTDSSGLETKVRQLKMPGWIPRDGWPGFLHVP